MGNHEQAQPIVSCLLFTFSVVYVFGALSLPLGEISQPGAGLFPAAVGIFLSLLTLLLLIQILQKKHLQDKKEAFPKGKDFFRLMGICLALIFYGIFFRYLGYILTTIILSAAILRLLEMHGWGRIFLISILISSSSYYFFCIILSIPFPRGIFLF